VTSYLLDTNSISETRRKLRDTNFDQFFGSLQPPQLFLSVMTIGELRKGVANQRKKDPSTSINLELWVNKIEREFSGRIPRCRFGNGTDLGRAFGGWPYEACG
jgi:predicted nucleic acid-binding protein